MFAETETLSDYVEADLFYQEDSFNPLDGTGVVFFEPDLDLNIPVTEDYGILTLVDRFGEDVAARYINIFRPDLELISVRIYNHSMYSISGHIVTTSERSSGGWDITTTWAVAPKSHGLTEEQVVRIFDDFSDYTNGWVFEIILRVNEDHDVVDDKLEVVHGVYHHEMYEFLEQLNKDYYNLAVERVRNEHEEGATE